MLSLDSSPIGKGVYGSGWHIYCHIAAYCIRDFNIQIGASAVKENRNDLFIGSQEGNDINIDIACYSLDVYGTRWHQLGEMTHNVEHRLLVEFSEAYRKRKH